MPEKLDYGIRKVVPFAFQEAVEKTQEALKAQGFGVISEIDMKEKLREKLGVDYKQYVILGACNPPLAYKALQAEPEIGLLLPCNVIVYEKDAANTIVSAVNPESILGAAGDDAVIADVARDARQRLQRVMEGLG